MEIRIKQVDAFTGIHFGGNPAGVVTDAAGLSDELKQKIAREMNLSETAFVSPSKAADFKVQFFTPRFEVDLCGHATIGTFSALHKEGKLPSDKNIFYQETKAGILPVELTSINNEKVFMMTQALPKFENIDLSKSEVAGLLGLSKDDLMDTPALMVNTGIWWLVFGVKTLDKLMNAKPDLKTIERISEQYGIIGITPFCLETLNPKYDYHLRGIAPYVGVAEDPVWYLQWMRIFIHSSERAYKMRRDCKFDRRRRAGSEQARLRICKHFQEGRGNKPGTNRRYGSYNTAGSNKNHRLERGRIFNENYRNNRRSKLGIYCRVLQDTE